MGLRPTTHEHLPLERTGEDWAFFLGQQKGRRSLIQVIFWLSVESCFKRDIIQCIHPQKGCSDYALDLGVGNQETKFSVLPYRFFFFAFHIIFKCLFRHLFCFKLLSPQFSPLWLCYKRFLCHFLPAKFLPQTQRTCKIWGYPFRIWIITLPFRMELPSSKIETKDQYKNILGISALGLNFLYYDKDFPM